MKPKHRTRAAGAFALGLALALVMGTTGCSVLGSTSEPNSGTTESSTDSSLVEPMPPQVAEERAAADSAAGEPYATGQDAAAVPQADRLVVLTAGLRLNVDDVEQAVDDVRAQAAEAGGMITDVQVSTDVDVPVYRYDAQGTLSDGAALSGWITARVPADAYTQFVDSVKDLGEIVRVSESESDVTQQHIDLQAQLDNLTAQEQQLRAFFEQAVNVEELLAIEQELTRVRSEIDSLEAQITYLERQAAMSTVTIELIGPQPVVSPQGESWGFVEAVTSGIRGAAGVIRFAIAFIIATSPIWILALVTGLVIWVIVRRRRSSRTPQEPE